MLPLCRMLRHRILSPVCSPLRPLHHRQSHETHLPQRQWFRGGHAVRCVQSIEKGSTQALVEEGLVSASAAVSDVPVAKVQQQVDYSTLCASLAEIQPWLPSRVEQVVQWHQQCVAMRLRNERAMTWMYISWHPIGARVNCGEQPNRGAASEAYSFGEALKRSLNGLVLTTATLPLPFERVVHLTFSESIDEEKKHSLWCEVMGRRSNVILTDAEGEIKLCAHQVGTKLSSLRQLQVGRQYQRPPIQSGIPPDSLTSGDAFSETLERVSAADRPKDESLVSVLVRCFQGVSPCLAQDLLVKSRIPATARWEELSLEQRECLFVESQQWLERLKTNTFELALCVETGRYSLLGLPGVWFKSVHALLDFYYRSIEVDGNASQLNHILRSTIKKNLTRLEAKRKKLVTSLKGSEQAESTQKTGDLIIANLHNYLPGSVSIHVQDWETGKELDIKLDPKKTAVDCAQAFFKKAKKLRRAKESVEPLLKELDQEIEYMKEVEESVMELEVSDDEEDAKAMSEIQEELIKGGYMKPPPDHHLAIKSKKKAKKNANKSVGDPDGLRLFTSPNGFRILIGRNNTQNDLVSKTKGKPGDLWFHARGVPGAHVLLKLDGRSDPPENDDVRCAAELAAYYSKARNGGKVPVSMTHAENVSKPRGAPPGLVQITKEKSLQVRPSESLASKDTNS